MTRHVPPSRIRYEQSHPTVTFRISTELRTRLERLEEKTGKSCSQLLKEGLGLIEREVGQPYDQGWCEGYAEALGLFDVPCARCGEPLVLDGRGDGRVRNRLLEVFRQWQHVECP